MVLKHTGNIQQMISPMIGKGPSSSYAFYEEYARYLGTQYVTLGNTALLYE